MHTAAAAGLNDSSTRFDRLSFWLYVAGHSPRSEMLLAACHTLCSLKGLDQASGNMRSIQDTIWSGQLKQGRIVLCRWQSCSPCQRILDHYSGKPLAMLCSDMVKKEPLPLTFLYRYRKVDSSVEQDGHLLQGFNHFCSLLEAEDMYE